ncbi:MAG: CoA transferase [Dehalococcoidia bacterium]
MIQSALEDLKVIDLTHYVAGPYCTKLLADYGADVVKIERPGVGDGARRMGPFPGDQPDPEKSGIFLHLNTNKRSLAIDLKTDQGSTIARELARRADVLVENFRPGVMASLGLSYEALSDINPGLVMVSITDFGQTGPYRDYKGSEIVDYALGGAYSVSGLAERNPVKLGGNAVQYLAGAHAAAATAVSVVGQAFRGHGDWIDISIMETQAGSPDRRTPMLVGYQYTGYINRRGEGIAPTVRPCEDGYVNIQYGLYWIDRVAAMLGMPEIKDDPRFCDPVESQKPENAEAFEAIFLGWLGDKTMAEAWALAQRNRVLSGPIYTMADVLADPSFRERGYWEEIDHPVAGRLTYPGLPFTTFGASRKPRRPAPRLGEHTDEVLAEAGYQAEEIKRLRAQGIVS